MKQRNKKAEQARQAVDAFILEVVTYNGNELRPISQDEPTTTTDRAEMKGHTWKAAAFDAMRLEIMGRPIGYDDIYIVGDQVNLVCGLTGHDFIYRLDHWGLTVDVRGVFYNQYDRPILIVWFYDNRGEFEEDALYWLD